MVIDVSSLQANGISRLSTFFGSKTKVRLFTSVGGLKVYYICEQSGAEMPLPASYVKVYARRQGSVSFFKDGYTDLSGRFEYGKLSGTSVTDVERFSILVENKEFGSLVKEAPAI